MTGGYFQYSQYSIVQKFTLSQIEKKQQQLLFSKDTSNWSEVSFILQQNIFLFQINADYLNVDHSFHKN